MWIYSLFAVEKIRLSCRCALLSCVISCAQRGVCGGDPAPCGVPLFYAPLSFSFFVFLYACSLLKSRKAVRPVTGCAQPSRRRSALTDFCCLIPNTYMWISSTGICCIKIAAQGFHFLNSSVCKTLRVQNFHERFAPFRLQLV